MMMTTMVKRVAGTLNLLDSLWTLYIVFVVLTTLSSCSSSGCPPMPNGWVFTVLPIVGVLLLVDSGLCFTNRWLAFPLGALLSFITIPLVALQWTEFGTTYAAAAIALAAAALVFDGMAAVSRTKLTEQSHPLNLPVFG